MPFEMIGKSIQSRFNAGFVGEIGTGRLADKGAAKAVAGEEAVQISAPTMAKGRLRSAPSVTPICIWYPERGAPLWT